MSTISACHGETFLGCTHFVGSGCNTQVCMRTSWLQIIMEWEWGWKEGKWKTLKRRRERARKRKREMQARCSQGGSADDSAAPAGVPPPRTPPGLEAPRALIQLPWKVQSASCAEASTYSPPRSALRLSQPSGRPRPPRPPSPPKHARSSQGPAPPPIQPPPNEPVRNPPATVCVLKALRILLASLNQLQPTTAPAHLLGLQPMRAGGTAPAQLLP